jgi:hypothetical protein
MYVLYKKSSRSRCYALNDVGTVYVYSNVCTNAGDLWVNVVKEIDGSEG